MAVIRSYNQVIVSSSAFINSSSRILSQDFMVFNLTLDIVKTHNRISLKHMNHSPRQSAIFVIQKIYRFFLPAVTCPASLIKHKRHKGFTLLELMIVIAILGVLAAIAVPNYMQYLERTRYTIAVTTIRQIDKQLNMFLMENNSYPANLMQIGLGNLKDPWGFSYQYLNLVTAKPADMSKIRKDRNLVPVNSDFDLYSTGPDGKSRAPFTAKDSLDDIVRASDGSFVGRATDY